MAHAATRHHHGHHARPVVAPGVFVDRGAAAKLAHHEDQRAVEQAAIFEVGDDGVQCAVHAGQQGSQAFFDAAPFHLIAMMIKVTPGTADGHEGGTSLHQAACQQRLFAQAVAAIAVTHGGGFGIEIEGALRVARHEHLIGLLRVAVRRGDLRIAIHAALPVVHLRQQFAPIAQAIHREPGGELEPPGQVLAAHRFKVAAQVPRTPDVRHERIRQRHIAGNTRRIRPAKLGGDGPHRRPAAAIAPIIGAPGQRVAGLHGDGRMIARRAIDRADQREPVHDLRRQRQVLAHMNARHLGGDVAKGAANLARRVRFRVPHVDVARPAGEPEEDDVRLARRPPRSSRQRLLL